MSAGRARLCERTVSFSGLETAPAAASAVASAIAIKTQPAKGTTFAGVLMNLAFLVKFQGEFLWSGKLAAPWWAPRPRLLYWYVPMFNCLLGCTDTQKS